MAWTNIPDANLDAGSPLRDVDLMALRDNIVYARNAHGLAAWGSPGTYTFTPIPGITTYKVSLVGGGGGGGGGNSSWGKVGGNGGNGGAAIFYVYNITTTQSITVGRGGAGGGVSVNGSPGGDSVAFGVTAHSGGGGGGGSQNVGVNGGHATADSSGLNAAAHNLATPFINSYGYGGGGGSAGDGSSSPGYAGNPGLCVIEW